MLPARRLPVLSERSFGSSDIPNTGLTSGCIDAGGTRLGGGLGQGRGWLAKRVRRARGVGGSCGKLAREREKMALVLQGYHLYMAKGMYIPRISAILFSFGSHVIPLLLVIAHFERPQRAPDLEKLRPQSGAILSAQGNDLHGNS